MCRPLFYAVLAQLVERPFCNRQADGSIPSNGTRAGSKSRKNTFNVRAWTARAWAEGENLWL